MLSSQDHMNFIMKLLLLFQEVRCLKGVMQFLTEQIYKHVSMLTFPVLPTHVERLSLSRFSGFVIKIAVLLDPIIARIQRR